MPNILVINGHGEKQSTKFQINSKHKIITPGPAEDSYTLSFDDLERHLEEVTSQNKIWPIKSRNQTIQWHRYNKDEMYDVAIRPLQPKFNVSMFADSVLKMDTHWEQLTNPAHDVMASGAIAEKLPDGKIVIYEGEDLIEYLQQLQAGTHQGLPLFFCDKALGKVKLLGPMLLSELYASVELIKEFEKDGTEIIVATCSPSTGYSSTLIEVQTDQPATDISSTAFVENAPMKVIQKKEKKLQMNEEKAMSDEKFKGFQSLLDEFNSLKNELVERASVNPEYDDVAKAATAISPVLQKGLEFFRKDPSDRTLRTFQRVYSNQIENSEAIFKKHRGWHQIDPTIRSILGVLAAITVFPALAVSVITTHGYIGTFFQTPETNSWRNVYELQGKIDKLTYEKDDACYPERSEGELGDASLRFD